MDMPLYQPCSLPFLLQIIVYNIYIYKCINEIRSQGNDNGYHFETVFLPFFNDGFHFAAELDKPDDFERS